MRLTDLTVEVRDLTLTRLGQVPPHALDFSATVVDSAPGEWHIRLPADHEMADPLRTPGAGIIVTGPDGVIFSGPMTRAEVESTWEDQTGVLVADGVTDEIILWDALAYPTPDFDWSSLFMPDAYWTDTGLAWEVMGQLVLDQIIDSGRFDGLLGGLLDLDLSAVDGSGGGPGANLIPNPNPDPAVAWNFDTWAPLTDSGWSSTEGSGYFSKDWGRVTGGSPHSFTEDGPLSPYSAPGTSNTVYPVPTGAGACPVTAATTYRVACAVYTSDNNINPADVSIGVEWFDGAGDPVSTSESTPTALVADPDGWEFNGTPDSGYNAEPDEEFAAPAGAEYGRPFVKIAADQSNETVSTMLVQDFWMGTA